MNFLGVESILKKGVIEVGRYLLSYPEQKRTEGYWISSQFKSRADIESHNRLCDIIQESFPEIPILSEESESKCFNCSNYFVIDPIDGTRSFVEGFDGWVVQASYVHMGFPVCSVIYAPKLEYLYTAIAGRGAYFNEKQISLDRSKKIEIITDNYPKPEGITKYMYEKLNISNYVESGSIALKLCLIATGEADLFIKDMKPRDWDIIPPMLLLSELGCFISDIEFKPFELNKGALSHNGLIACRSLAQVSSIMEAVKDYKAEDLR